MNASAELIAVALDGRKTSRGWRARCPGHDDRHPSLDITETPDGKVLFIDRSGRCAQAEIIAALRERSLWSAEHQPSRPIEDPFPASAFHDEPAPARCLIHEPRCQHWKSFDRRWLLAQLRENLVEACRELIEKFKRADRPVTSETLRKGIKFAIPFGAIVPAGVGNVIVAKAIDVVVGEFTTSTSPSGRGQAAA